MAWEVRFFTKERGSDGTPPGGPTPFQAEPDALTHARFLLHRAPDGRVEVFRRGTRRRAVYRLRGDHMVGLADQP